MSTIKKNILAISGSTKSGSTNNLILDGIAERHAGRAEVNFYKIEHLPFFNPDLDNENPPAEVVHFRNLIANADGVVICTPEYVFSLPGVLKNAIEWTISTTVFSEKPVALIVASASGEAAFESLQLIMKTIYARFDDHSTLLIKSAKSQFNTDKTIAEIDNLTAAFLATIDNK